MDSKKMLFIPALALLVFVCHASMSSHANEGFTTTQADLSNDNNDNANSSPDFNGNGVVDIPDFLMFVESFGLRQGDEGYEARFDLDGDGTIGIGDFLIFVDSFGKEVPSAVVSIPDANLRAAIEDALGKASGAPITQAEMRTLTWLRAYNAGISDLTGLEFATNLETLWLIGNNVSDISALSGLTNLTELWLRVNQITDISALSGLTNLERLWIDQNNITDISPLAGLTNLTELWIGQNNFTDISVLSGLTNLMALNLADSSIEDISALSGLTNLTELWLRINQITDISALSGLTNLTELLIDLNNVSDISVLSGLTNLIRLGLGLNNVSDISVLSGLTNLTRLELRSNSITDISPLAGLINLTELNLAFNNVSDISVLSGLTSLMALNLADNSIEDISALSGLTNLRDLDLRGNPYEVLPKGDFDIELVLLGDFTESQERVLQYVARRWMAVITEDLPDYEFSEGWSGKCHDQSFKIPSGERIDDLRIYVSTLQGPSVDFHGVGGTRLLREETHLPVVGCMAFDVSRANLLVTGLHEIGHVLGFGTIWYEFGFYQNPPDGDPHFNGPLAVAAFDDAGGRDYKGAKVPLQGGGGHWRIPVLEGELMTPYGGWTRRLSAITVQSLADLGYGVDVSQAEAYTLPGAASAKASAKIAAAMPVIPNDRLRGRLESAEWIGGRGFDLRDDPQMWHVGLSAQAEPKLSCGVDFITEPIYVVDQQGRIIRTIGNR